LTERLQAVPNLPVVLRPSAHFLLAFSRQAFHTRPSLLTLGEIKTPVLFSLQDTAAIRIAAAALHFNETAVDKGVAMFQKTMQFTA